MHFKKYSNGLKYFFNGINKPFKKLFSSIKKKWKRSLKFANLKYELERDIERIKYEVINNEIGSKITIIDDNRYISKIVKEKDGSIKINHRAFFINKYFRKIITDKTLRDLKVLDLIKKIEKFNRGEWVEEENIKELFDKYQKKMDKRVKRFISRQEASFIEKVKFGEYSSLSRKEYQKKKIELQIELVKLQEWAVANKKKIAVVFEGRDAAGKGSSIKRFIEYINPKHYRVVALDIPTKEESENWFSRYEKHLPQEGEIVFFDRSWYNRAVIEPTMGYCTDEQYKKFMGKVNDWENKMIEDDVILIKFWFSINKEKQLERFENRKQSPLKHWKFSPNDEKTVSKWDILTKYKEQMFEKTSTDKSPWVIVNSNDKRVSRLNSIKYVLSKIDYSGKDTDKDLVPSENVVKVLE